MSRKNQPSCCFFFLKAVMIIPEIQFGCDKKNANMEKGSTTIKRVYLHVCMHMTRSIVLFAFNDEGFTLFVYTQAFFYSN